MKAAIEMIAVLNAVGGFAAAGTGNVPLAIMCALTLMVVVTAFSAEKVLKESEVYSPFYVGDGQPRGTQSWKADDQSVVFVKFRALPSQEK